LPLLLEGPLVADFLSFLRLKNVSPGTLQGYRSVLRDLFIRMNLGTDRGIDQDIDQDIDQGIDQDIDRDIDRDTDRDAAQVIGPGSHQGINSPEQITPDHLRRYIAGLQARGLAAKTVSDRVTILKRFFAFLHAEGQIPEDPAARLPLPKVGKRLPKTLNIAEVETLLSVLDRDVSALGRRDRVLFHLLYATGLRVAEAMAVQVRNIDFVEGYLCVVGKGDQERRIYLKPILLLLLDEHIRSEGLTDYLFPGKPGRPERPESSQGPGGPRREADHLTDRNVRYRLLGYARSAGIKRRVTPHTLRHSIAVHYLQGGAPVSFVQGLLGHASLATTGEYLRLTDQMAKEITLKTETALERFLQKRTSVTEGAVATAATEMLVAKERREDYEAPAGEDTMLAVLEWLARPPALGD
jgi:site-specific recombinase XerD